MAKVLGITDDKAKKEQASRGETKKVVPFTFEVNGESVEPTKVSAESFKSLMNSAQTQAPVYYSKEEQGGYTTDPTKATYSGLADVSINIDSKNNKINISAPKSVLESEPFKQNFGSDEFKALAKSYINDPNNELTMTDGSKKTAQEMMDEYQKYLKNMADSRIGFNVMADSEKELYGLEGLTDQQLVIASSGLTDNSSKSEVVYLPSKEVAGFDFGQYESYDADNNTISQEDWKKFNQSKAFDDQHVLKVKEAARDAILNMSKGATEEDFVYTDEAKEAAVRWQSLYRSLENTTTDVSIPVATAGLIEGAIRGIGENIIEMGATLGKGLEKVGEGLWQASPAGLATSWVQDNIDFFDDDSGALKFIMEEGSIRLNPTNVGGAFITAGKTLQSFAALGNAFEDMVTLSTAGKEVSPLKAQQERMASVFVELRDIAGIPVSDEEHAKFDNLQTTTAKLQELRQEVVPTLTIGNAIGGFIGEALKQTMVVNNIGGMAGGAITGGVKKVTNAYEMAEGLSKFTGYVSKFGTAEELASLAKSAIALNESANFLSQGVEKGSLFVSKLADIAMQGIADTIMKDSDAINKLYENGDTSGIANELKTNLIWNAIGEAGAFGGSKAIEAIGETKLGQGIKLGAGKATNALAAAKNQLKLAAENKISKLKIFGDQIGAGTREYNELIIDLEKQAAKAKTIGELEEAVSTRIDLENQFDSLLRGSRVTLAEMITNPILEKNWSDYNKSVTELSSAITKNGDTLLAGSKVSAEVADYLTTKMHLQRALADPSLADSKWANDLTDKLGTLQESLSSKGLLELADRNYTDLQKLTKALTDYQLSEGVISRADIESLRKTGYWGKDGEEFFHTRLIKNEVGTSAEESAETALRDYEKSVNDFSPRKFHAKESEVFNLSKNVADGHYMDPNLIIEAEMYRTATAVQGKQWGEALLNASKVNKKLGGVDDLKAQSKVSTAFEKLKKTTQAKLSDISTAKDYEVALDEIYPEVARIRGENVKQSAELKSQRAKAKKSYDKAVDNYAGMQLDANDMNELRVKLGDKTPIPVFDADSLTEEGFESLVDGLDKNTVKLLKQNIESVVGDGAEITLSNFKKAYAVIDGLDTTLERSFINNSSKITKSKAYKDLIRRVRSENNDFRNAAYLDKYQAKYDDIIAKQQDLKLKSFKEGSTNIVRDVNDMVEGIQETLGAKIKSDKGTRALLDTLVGEGIDEDTAVQYLVIDQLRRTTAAAGVKSAKRPLRESIKKYLTSSPEYKGMKVEDLDEFADIMTDMYDDIVESQWNSMTRSLIDNGHQDLVDMDEVFTRVSGYADEILGQMKSKSKNVIQILDENGKLQLIETDPVVKDLYEWRPNYADSSPIRFFSLTNRVFRLFTTGIPITSFARQWIKDPMNAYVAGGAVPFMNRGMSNFFGSSAYGKITDSIVESLQDDVIAGLKKEWGEEGWAIFEKQAREAGQSVGRAAVEYELVTRPQALVGAGGTETKFYQDISRARKAQNAYEYGGNISDGKKGKTFLEKFEDKLSKLEDVMPNNTRETYLRNIVYGQQFQDAIKHGKSLDEARAIATRFMNDATTNFARPLAMGNRIARSIPYLSAAFNGKASFFRLLELDPTGVGGRLLGGVILPYMSLLAESLGKTENVEVYKNLKEYQKDGNLVFVTNGQVVTVPIPEELSNFLNPFRQIMEKAFDATDNSFTEFALNDLLQLPALDLSGFYDIDQSEIYNNQTFWSRLGRGTEKLFMGQLAPAAVKSGYMMVTGRDPYTGYEIDRSYVYDDGQGNVDVMDTNDNKIAKSVSDWCKSVGIKLSPSAAYAIIGTTFGKGLLSLGDNIGSLLSGEPTNVGSPTLGAINSLFTAEARDRGAQEWRSAVNDLYDRKESLLQSEEYQKLVQKINNSSINEETRQKYISEYNTYIQDYTKSVVDTANAMKNKYGLTVAQQASVISLLTFTSNTTPMFTANARENSSDTYFTARSLAYETMQKLGFEGTTDTSIFGYGYYKTNQETGQREYTYQYNTPMAILDMGNIVWGQSDIALVNIKQEISSSGIKDDWNAFYTERSKLYDQASSEKDKKIKNAIYNQIDDMNAKWSNRVMRAVVPYIDNYGLDGLLNNRELISYLEKYIQVPSNLMGQAKYMSTSKTGLDKNAGFAQSYMKKWYELYQKEKGAK